MRTREANADDEYAERMADAIDAYVRDAAIVYVNGLTASGDPVAGIFNGNLN